MDGTLTFELVKKFRQSGSRCEDLIRNHVLQHKQLELGYIRIAEASVDSFAGMHDFIAASLVCDPTSTKDIDVWLPEALIGSIPFERVRRQIDWALDMAVEPPSPLSQNLRFDKTALLEALDIQDGCGGPSKSTGLGPTDMVAIRKIEGYYFIEIHEES